MVVRYTRNAIDNTLSNGEGLLTNASNTAVDWYNQQTLGLTNSTIYWKNIAPKPGTSQYAAERSGKNDELHVVVVDDSGTVSGISGNVLEKFTNLSKVMPEFHHHKISIIKHILQVIPTISLQELLIQ